MPVKHKTLPSHEYLHECFDYNPDTGAIFWRTRPRSHFSSDNAYAVHYGKDAGRQITHVDPHGYLNLTLDGMHYRAARVIWKMVTWEEPPAIVDHIDRNKLNNRWLNLREATPQQSLQNRNFKLGASGYKGVVKTGNKWRASIRRGDTQRYLGTYTTAEEAAKAYDNAARELHGEFYSG